MYSFIVPSHEFHKHFKMKSYIRDFNDIGSITYDFYTDKIDLYKSIKKIDILYNSSLINNLGCHIFYNQNFDIGTTGLTNNVSLNLFFEDDEIAFYILLKYFT